MCVCVCVCMCVCVCVCLIVCVSVFKCKFVFECTKMCIFSLCEERILAALLVMIRRHRQAGMCVFKCMCMPVCVLV